MPRVITTAGTPSQATPIPLAKPTSGPEPRAQRDRQRQPGGLAEAGGGQDDRRRVEHPRDGQVDAADEDHQHLSGRHEADEAGHHQHDPQARPAGEARGGRSTPMTRIATAPAQAYSTRRVLGVSAVEPPAAAGSAGSAVLTMPPPSPGDQGGDGAEQDGDDEEQPLEQRLVQRVDAGEEQHVDDERQRDRTGHGAQRAAPPAAEGDAADHDRGDRGEDERAAGVRRRRRSWWRRRRPRPARCTGRTARRRRPSPRPPARRPRRALVSSLPTRRPASRTGSGAARASRRRPGPARSARSARSGW